VITVADDGKGLAASADEIFKPGFSTAKEVTDVSGRGIGLPVVKKMIEAIGGQVSLESSPQQGTSFRLEIPLTLAVIKTLFVEVGKTLYAVPVAAIDRLVTVEEESVKGMFDTEAIVLDGEDIPITRLDLLFGQVASSEQRVTKQPIVVVRRGEERLGLVVDSLISTQEVVIKPLSRAVRENKYFAGSALIGSGTVVLVLDVSHLVLSRRRQMENHPPPPNPLPRVEGEIGE
jgi:two-component system chemotaxis sensor kinase CheA